jgi:2,3-dihydroxybenzoate---[aryl-carrier protein] ligase
MNPVRQTWPADFAERYRRAGYWRGETFGQFLRDRARSSPDRTAVIAASGNPRWSYRELDLRADAMAAGFLDLGLRPGDRVVVQLPNIPEFFSVVFGLFRAGILPVFALPLHRSVEITHFARTAEASAYVIPQSHDRFDYRDLARQVCEDVPSVEHVIVVGEPGPYTSLSLLEVTSPRDLPSPSSDTVAFMQLSGGSTGLSKLIPRTHDDYIYTLRESAAICGLGPESVYLGTLPIAHNYPMSSPGVFGALYAGATVALSATPSPDDAFAIIEREGVTITGVVPPIALIWIEAAATTAFDLSSLEVLQVGGAKLSAEVARRITALRLRSGQAPRLPSGRAPRLPSGRALNVTLQQVFGMAEGLVNYTRLHDPEEIVVHTQGRPISPGDEILIVDDEDRPLPAGMTGHLLTRGPYTIRAYHNAPEVNARAFTADGYYRTGDIVSLTHEGYLVVHGRATDHINRGGEKVSAEEIEEHLLAHPNVHDAAVVSVPDPYLGERACAFVVAKGQRPRAVELKTWIRARGLAAFKVPDQIIFVDAFPATSVGKISRKELRAALRDTL